MLGAAPATIHEFADPGDLAEALSSRVADTLGSAVATRGHATLAVSGGSTPAPFFDALSRRDIDWGKVAVTLVDERFVPPSSERSNERLVRERLLKARAADAPFIPLYHPARDVDEAALAANAAVSALPRPFDAVILGMGADGHTASYFPDAGNLGALLAPDTAEAVMAVRTEAGGEPRLTLTLPLLASARFLALHIEGDVKKSVLHAALSDDGAELPVGTVIDRAQTPVAVFWAPSPPANPIVPEAQPS